MDPSLSFPRYGVGSEQSMSLVPNDSDDDNVEEDKISDSENEKDDDDSNVVDSQSESENGQNGNDDDDSEGNEFDVENDEYLSFIHSVFFDDGASDKSGTDGDEDEEYDPKTDQTAGNDDDLDINDEYYHVTRKEVHDLVDASIHALARNPDDSDRSAIMHRKRTDKVLTHSSSAKLHGNLSKSVEGRLTGSLSSLRYTAGVSTLQSPTTRTSETNLSLGASMPPPSLPTSKISASQPGGVSGSSEEGHGATGFGTADVDRTSQGDAADLDRPGHPAVSTHVAVDNKASIDKSKGAAPALSDTIAAENEKKLAELQKKNRLLSILVSKMFGGAGERLVHSNSDDRCLLPYCLTL